MKTMTFKKLMEKCEEGKAEVNCWASRRTGLCEVTFYKNVSDRGTRQTVQVTNVPADEDL